jgi:hypothetical protein
MTSEELRAAIDAALSKLDMAEMAYQHGHDDTAELRSTEARALLYSVGTGTPLSFNAELTEVGGGSVCLSGGDLRRLIRMPASVEQEQALGKHLYRSVSVRVTIEAVK